VAPVHAVIHKLRDTYELHDNDASTGTVVNGQKIKKKRLTDGDRIQIGDSEFVYTTREAKQA
jgi:pSer/pThr/pTyr-binding forkhead associated (FHA) protein